MSKNPTHPTFEEKGKKAKAPISDKREIARQQHTHGSRRADAPADQSPKD